MLANACHHRQAVEFDTGSRQGMRSSKARDQNI
jgi:hypothetical protein